MRHMADALAGGADPPPAQEPAASPRLAPDPEPPSRRRRSAGPAVAGAIAVAAIVAGVVAWAVAPRSASLDAPGAEQGRALEPLRPRADARTGEEIAPFSGFAVAVDTDPAGAVVSVGGVPRGEAPVLAGVDCAPGARVEIAAEKAGFPAATASTTCRRDALVKLTIPLRRF